MPALTTSPEEKPPLREKTSILSPEDKPIVKPELTIPVPATTPLSTPRDLSMFEVDDNSPPFQVNRSRLEPRCSDGRNLSAIKQTNFVRGGHRLDPDASSSKGGLQAKSQQKLSFLFGQGKPVSAPTTPLHGKSPRGEQIALERGKFTSTLHSSYGKGKGENDFAWKGKSKPDHNTTYAVGEANLDTDATPKGK